ncbi:MAG: TonB family protein [Flavobacteriales bacterium]|nr:TonB family protein [Flavobacteriales bacterium]
MKTTEKPKNNLEKFRGIFFQIGLIISTSLTFLAFEWTTPVYVADLPKPDIEVEGDFDIPIITYRSTPVKPEIKPIAPKVDPSKINIVKIDPIDPTPNPDPIVDPDPVFDPNKWTKPEVVEPEEAPVPIAEVMPEFEGGAAKLFEYLSRTLKYPELAKSTGIQGKVFIQFVVDKKGKIKDAKVIQGINALLDKEALRVVESMPDWTPGRQHGKPVSVIYNLPISFKLK